MTEGALRMIFAQYDTSGLGHLNSTSFRRFLEELGQAGLPEEKFQRCFEVVDQFGTGVITLENFLKLVPYLYEVNFDPPPQEKTQSLPRIDSKDPASFLVKVKRIGKGSFGQVFKALDTRSNQTVALKVIDVDGTEDDIEEVQREIMFQANCKSPFIAQYYGSYLRGAELWISMEYIPGGSCLDLIKFRLPTEHQISLILKSTVLGLQYLHSTKKYHRDIKSGNILVSTQGEVKLVDFGVGAQIYQTVAAKCTFVGTPLWMAPEVILQQPQTFAIDIWSLGITAIELAKGAPPKNDLHPMQVLFSVPEDPPPVLEGDFSQEFKDFVATCLKKDPKERPQTSELLGHPFLQKEDRSQILKEYVALYENWRDGIPDHEPIEDDSAALQKKEKDKENNGNFWDFDDDDEGREDAEDSGGSETGDFPPSQDVSQASTPVISTPTSPRSPRANKPKELLEEVLDKFGLLEIKDVLEENDVDYDALLLLNEDDIKDLGFKLGMRKKVSNMITTLKAEKKRKSSKEPKEGKETKEPKASREPKEARMSREHKDERDGKEKNERPKSSRKKSENLESPISESLMVEKAKEELTPQRSPDFRKWTPEEVSSWMAEEGFSQYAQTFSKNQVDGVALGNLDLKALDELGLTIVGVKVKMLMSIEALKNPAQEYGKGLSIILHEASPPPAQAPASFSSQNPLHQSIGKKKSGIFQKFSIRRPSEASFSHKGSKSEQLQQALTQISKPQEEEKPHTGTRVELPAPDITADQIQGPDYSGWLVKQGGQRKNWKKRWFVLKDCVLYYFPTAKGTKAKGMIMLPSYNFWVAPETKKKYSFKAVHDSARTYFFVASNYEDMKQWMKVMHEASVVSKPIKLINEKDVRMPQTVAPAQEDVSVDLTPKRRENNANQDGNLQRFLDILSYVDEKELKPFFEMARRDVEEAVGAYYASKMSQP